MNTRLKGLLGFKNQGWCFKALVGASITDLINARLNLEVKEAKKVDDLIMKLLSLSQPEKVIVHRGSKFTVSMI